MMKQQLHGELMVLYAFDFATLSAGVESVDDGATAEGFFVGLSFPEVGAGSLDIGMGTTGNFARWRY